MQTYYEEPHPGLYDARYERDACGIGFVAHINGRKSHSTISDALTVLENMEHRGACGCETNTGDGAGISFQIPHAFLKSECVRLGISLPDDSMYGVGMVFFPKGLVEECKELFSEAAEQLGLVILGYRQVPVNREDICFAQLCKPYNKCGYTKKRNRLLFSLSFVSHYGVQGTADQWTIAQLLSRFTEQKINQCLCHCSFTFCHQYFSLLVAGPAFPLPGPQWRNQYATGQSQLVAQQ